MRRGSVTMAFESFSLGFLGLLEAGFEASTMILDSSWRNFLYDFRRAASSVWQLLTTPLFRQRILSQNAWNLDSETRAKLSTLVISFPKLILS